MQNWCSPALLANLVQPSYLHLGCLVLDFETLDFEALTVCFTRWAIAGLLSVRAGATVGAITFDVFLPIRNSLKLGMLLDERDTINQMLAWFIDVLEIG